MRSANLSVVDESSIGVRRGMRAQTDRIVLDGITWNQYDQILKALDGRHIFLTYDRGRLEIMTTGSRHELGKKLLARLLEVYVYEQKIPVVALGNWTLRKHSKLRGLEADECYYIRHELDVRGKMDLDIRHDPPPDLAIEIEVSRRLKSRRSIYAALGVPEVWRWDGQDLRFLQLGDDGKYTEISASLNLPQIKSDDLQRFMRMQPGTPVVEILESFGRWARELPGAGR